MLVCCARRQVYPEASIHPLENALEVSYDSTHSLASAYEVDADLIAEVSIVEQ